MDLKTKELQTTHRLVDQNDLRIAILESESRMFDKFFMKVEERDRKLYKRICLLVLFTKIVVLVLFRYPGF
jgi:hypothetical protein